MVWELKDSIMVKLMLETIKKIDQMDKANTIGQMEIIIKEPFPTD